VATADENLISKWEDKFKACAQQRVNFEKQWHANLAFYFGRQWIQIQNISVTGSNVIGFALTDPKPTERWRVRHVSNKIKRIIRTEITKLTKEEPQFYTVPASTEEKDRAAALAADSISDYLLHSRYFNIIRGQATFWVSICGTGYIKTFYDETKKDTDGQMGKIVYEAVSPFHLFVPWLQIQDIEEQPYAINAKAVDHDIVSQFYGKPLEGSKDVSKDILESRFLTSLGIKTDDKKDLKQCYVKECWVKPCKDFPQGVMFVYAEKKLLYMYNPTPAPPEEEQGMPPVGGMPAAGGGQTYDMGNSDAAQLGMGDLTGFDLSKVGLENPAAVGLPSMADQTAYPYQHGEFPFAKIDHIPAGRFYAQSTIDDLMSIQKDYNRTRSVMKEAANIAGKPQWWMTKGSYDVAKHTSEPGIILQVNPGMEGPTPLQQPELPQQVKDELDIAIRDMDDISGQFEIAKGRTPPGVEAASAIAYLQEENDTILYHTVASIEAAIQKIGIQSLSLVHEFWTEDRVVRATSTNSYFEARIFKGSDLNPYMDFRVESESVAPRSKAAKQAFITELLKTGALPIEKAMRYLQMNETNKLYEELMVDSRHAQRENYMMSKGQPLYKPSTETDEMGQPVPRQEIVKDDQGKEMMQQGQPVMRPVTVNDFDNHPVHVMEHENYMKSQEYELLNPQIQQIFLDHLQEHKQEIFQEQMAQQQLGLAPQEEAGGGQTPSSTQQESAPTGG